MERTLPALASIAAVMVIALRIADAFALGLVGDGYGDALSYIEGTRRVFAGEPLYTAMQQQPYALGTAIEGRGYVYPPTAAFLLAPLALGHPVVVAWNILGLASALAVAAAVARSVGASWPVTLWVVAGLLVMLGGDFGSGQAAPHLAALFGLMWLAPRWSGWLAVLGGLVKAQPIVGLAWAWRRGASWKTPLVAGSIVALAVELLIPGGWLGWVGAMRNGYADCGPYSWPSLGCYGLGWLGWVGGGLAFLMAFRVRNDAAAFALLGLAAFLPAPEIYPSRMLLPAIAALPLLPLVRGVEPADEVDVDHHRVRRPAAREVRRVVPRV